MKRPGVPFAQPLSGGRNPLWKQTKDFTYDELAALIERKAKRRGCDMDSVVALYVYCREKFGRAPDNPTLASFAASVVRAGGPREQVS